MQTLFGKHLTPNIEGEKTLDGLYSIIASTGSKANTMTIRIAQFMVQPP
jgi:hypothetical protein